MTEQLFNYLPPGFRQEQIARVKKSGITKAIKMPAAYFTKIRSFKDAENKRQDCDLLWVNCSNLDSAGYVIKAGPDFLIERAQQVLTNYDQKFEVIEL